MKYRRAILNEELEGYLKNLVQEIARDKGFTVHLFEVGEEDNMWFKSLPSQTAQEV